MCNADDQATMWEQAQTLSNLVIDSMYKLRVGEWMYYTVLLFHGMRVRPNSPTLI